jgi:hypothetical protein
MGTMNAELLGKATRSYGFGELLRIACSKRIVPAEFVVVIKLMTGFLIGENFTPVNEANQAARMDEDPTTIRQIVCEMRTPNTQ